MDEVYRTVLGHFRHEVGHYYWDQLIDNTDYLRECRELFGDDREDYGEALKKHYKDGVPSDWRQHYISAYASMHPWEDWAESWAQYLHINYKLVNPNIEEDALGFKANIKTDPYLIKDFNEIFNLWIPLTFALNSLNRSMGLHDLYPFVVPLKVIGKLSFIHKVCFETRQKASN
jgi:hypothetical protein